MSSATSPVRATLEGYLAGRVNADRVAAVASAAFYGDGRHGARQALRAVLDVVERAAPGVVELAARDEGSGFELRLAERPFPARYEADLRRAVESALVAWPDSGGTHLFARFVSAIGRWVGLGRPAQR